MSWTENIPPAAKSFTTKALRGVELLADGFHAIPKAKKGDNNPLKALPSMHRLLNVFGMVGAYSATQYLTNIMFACKINGSQCEELPIEQVPKPLHFLHGIFSYNPMADDPSSQWHKVAQQLAPAIGGAVGAIYGSKYFFIEQNGKEKAFNDLMKKEKLHPLQADTAAVFAQGLKGWRKLAGSLAWPASASGTTGPMYGTALNSAFLLGNNNRTLAGLVTGLEESGLKSMRWLSQKLRLLNNTTSRFNVGPEGALAKIIEGTEMALRDAANPAKQGKVAEAYGKDIVEGVIMPLIVKMKPHEKSQLVDKMKGLFEGLAREHQASGLSTQQVQDTVKAHIHDLLLNAKVQNMGEGMKVGQTGLLGWLAEKLGAKRTVDEIRSRMMRAPAMERA